MTIALTIWLIVVFIAWGALSILLTPLIGHFLSGAFHEAREKGADLRNSSQRRPDDSVVHLGAKLARPWVHPKNARNYDIEVG